MNKSNKIKLIEGGIVGAVLGVAAGILLTPESGKKFRGDIKKKSAEFQAYLAPKFKKLKEVGEEGYDSFVKEAIKSYSKAKGLSEEEKRMFISDAKNSWKQIKKHLS